MVCKTGHPRNCEFSVRLAWPSASADDNCDREADADVDVGKQFLRRLARHSCHVQLCDSLIVTLFSLHLQSARGAEICIRQCSPAARGGGRNASPHLRGGHGGGGVYAHK